MIKFRVNPPPMNCDAEKAAGNHAYIIGLYLDGKQWRIADYVSLEGSLDMNETSGRTLGVLQNTRAKVESVYGDRLDDRSTVSWLREPYHPYISKWFGFRQVKVTHCPLVWIPPDTDVEQWITEYIKNIAT